MSHPTELLQAFCTALNAVKRTAWSPATVDPSHYLGGDLGIDSIEMLEIWFRVEKALAIQIPDDAKRDIYTVDEAMGVIVRHVPARATAGAGDV